MSGALDAIGPVHLVGIGGAGMSAIAKILIGRGIEVSGSDMKSSPALDALAARGARVFVGHAASNVVGASTVVVSSAIRESNPELRAAREAGAQILHRAQMLALLMRGRRGIAVSGTHGKTTTTAMLALVLQRAGLDPSFLVGGEMNEGGTNAVEGTGEWLVAEADESDGSFLWLGPEIAIVTNVEAEHLDHYGDEARVREAFVAFMSNASGTIVACADDAGVRAVLERCARPVVTYGIDAGEWRARRTSTGAGGQTSEISRDGTVVGTLQLLVPGAHNVRNALAAIAAADLAGVSFEAAAAALATFGGVQRRFQVRGIARDVTVVDDYSHHPTEVRAALATARERTEGRVFAIFQPHLYSRTAFFGAALGAALAAADSVVVTDVYGAREDPQPGITGKLVVDGVLDEAPRRRVAYLPRRGDIAPYVSERARAGDMVITIGAGDVTMLCDEILRRIGERTR
jgi:UDP-N-acetylmuramate--alanine ligase